TAGGLACIPAVRGPFAIAALLFAAGACSGAFYPLGLALLGERLPASDLARANAWYLAINCAGSLCGPVLAGTAMDWFGQEALFPAALIAVLLVVAAWAVLRRRPGIGGTSQDHSDFPMPPGNRHAA